jgi:hypothetical protein
MFTPAASLAAIGLKVQELQVCEPIRVRVQIAQKTVTHAPGDKLYDAFIAILAGAHGLVEINSRLRADTALQRAFGRNACAEQSVVQQTLDACTSADVAHLEQAFDEIYRQHSRGYGHDYSASFQLLDVDMSGMPCGPKAALATKGYFAKQRNRRGRQLGRVLATHYGEVVSDRLFEGKTQLTRALQPLMQAAEETLRLDETKRARTIVRIDAGGGSLDEVNWLLARGYVVHAKDYSGKQAKCLAKSVEQWVDDPHISGRQFGWVTQAPTAYVRPVRRIAVRCRQRNGQWAVGVLISALSARDVLLLTRQSLSLLADPVAVLGAYITFYDERGGGIETSFKGDKQGLGLTKRSKKRFEAQQIVMLLGTVAHNVIVWAQQWLTAPLSPASPPTPEPMTCTPAPVQHYGMMRMVRDVFHVSGFLGLDASGQVVEVVLNQDAFLARRILSSLRQLLAPLHVAVILDKT